jgi:hypothetical protein
VPQSVKFNIISLRNFAPSLPYSAVIRLLIQPLDILKQIIFNYKKKMKKNVGTIDKTIRILVAVVIAVLFFTNVISGTLGIVLLILAVVFVIVSLISFCPLYLPLGINTGKKI